MQTVSTPFPVYARCDMSKGHRFDVTRYESRISSHGGRTKEGEWLLPSRHVLLKGRRRKMPGGTK